MAHEKLSEKWLNVFPHNLPLLTRFPHNLPLLTRSTIFLTVFHEPFVPVLFHLEFGFGAQRWKGVRSLGGRIQKQNG